MRSPERARPRKGFCIAYARYYESVLGVLRHEGSFHYDPRVFNRAVNGGIADGQMFRAEIMGLSRFVLVDQIVDEVSLKAAGGNVELLLQHIGDAVDLAHR